MRPSFLSLLLLEGLAPALLAGKNFFRQVCRRLRWRRHLNYEDRQVILVPVRVTCPLA
jgi:hypothetical protein